jgi:hypothetical protein
MDTVEHYKYEPEFENRQPKREEIISQHKDALDAMISRKGRGIKFRRYFVSYVRQISTVKFTSEDQEYKYIGKAGRLPWTDAQQIQKCFTVDELPLVYEIMLKFGAFDY